MFAERLQAAAEVKPGPPCLTCKALRSLDTTDLAAYHGAVSDEDVPSAVIARALGIRPNTYLTHVHAGHTEPR
jgi:hypothetical protein